MRKKSKFNKLKRKTLFNKKREKKSRSLMK